MTDQQALEVMIEGWDWVFRQGALLAELPIEDWLQAFDRAEGIAPTTDPTLYRNYVYSGKGEIIKDVLRAALHFKQAIKKAQADTLKLEPQP